MDVVSEESKSLKLTDTEIGAKIEKRFVNDPEGAARARTTASLLAPMLRSSDKLGLNPDEQVVIRKYARQAGERAAELTRNSTDFVSTIDKMLLPIIDKYQSSPTPEISDVLTQASEELHQKLTRARQEVDSVLIETELQGTPISRDEAVQRAINSKDPIRSNITRIGFHVRSYSEDPTRFVSILKEMGLVPQNATYEQISSALPWREYDNFRAARVKSAESDWSSASLHERKDASHPDDPRRFLIITPSESARVGLLAAETEPPTIIPASVIPKA